MKRLSKIKPFFVLSIIGALCACSDNEQAHVKGIDVSHFQGDVDWKAVKADGVGFAYIKASEGVTLGDAKFAANWQGAKHQSIYRGGYHVFAPDDDGKAQAQHFITRLKSEKVDYNGALPPVLDIEAIPQDRLACARPQIKKWLKHVEATLGCKPIIYTSPATWDEEFPGAFTGYELWLADYAEAPTLPTGWKNWTFWQHSNTGQKRGIEGAVDLDRFNGTAHQLARTTCFKW